ncbi:MAG: twin-arginine translocase TatA/TatE family subunit [Parvibaculales bacterium]
MGLSWIQILIVIVLLVLLFGRGRISSLMGDIASGITSFRKGLREGTKELDDTTAPTIDGDQETDNTDTPPKE